MFERRKISDPIEGLMQPFRIVGNVYFAGTFQASSHLIDTGEGLIMIDTGYRDTLFMVLRSVYELGFRPSDIRYIINTHWHGDHTEATRYMAALSGAKTLIGVQDEARAKRYFTPDILVHDGDTLALGHTVVSFMETPGHTKGTLSLFFDAQEDGKTYRVGMFGGAGANTLQKGSFDYENCRADYRRSVQRLMGEQVDVFIGNHTWNNNTYAFGKLLLETGENRFKDPTLWNRFLAYCLNRLDQIEEDERET